MSTGHAVAVPPYRTAAPGRTRCADVSAGLRPASAPTCGHPTAAATAMSRLADPMDRRVRPLRNAAARSVDALRPGAGQSAYGRSPAPTAAQAAGAEPRPAARPRPRADRPELSSYGALCDPATAHHRGHHPPRPHPPAGCLAQRSAWRGRVWRDGNVPSSTRMGRPAAPAHVAGGGRRGTATGHRRPLRPTAEHGHIGGVARPARGGPS